MKENIWFSVAFAIGGVCLYFLAVIGLPLFLGFVIRLF
jgi:hypothetical protein